MTRVSGMPSYRVAFECGHVAVVLGDEYGDGSAWCQQCGEFQTYERCPVCSMLNCDHARVLTADEQEARAYEIGRWPAAVVVHWPTGPHPACVEHAEQLVGLSSFLGSHIACTPLTRPEVCVNCKNEKGEN